MNDTEETTQNNENTEKDKEETYKGIDYYNGFLEDYLRANYGLTNPRTFKMLCINPEHPDTRPSMCYDYRHNRLKCFSCGAYYDLINLVMIEQELKTEKEALAYLKNYYEGQPLPENYKKSPDLEGTSLKDFRAFISSRYEETLADQRKKALAYSFLKARGFSPEIADKLIKAFSLCLAEHKETRKTNSGAEVELSYSYLLFPHRRFYGTKLIISDYQGRLIPESVHAPNPSEIREDHSKRYKRPAGVASTIYDYLQALNFFNEDTPIIITEGELDTLSLYAVALEYSANPDNKNKRPLLASVALSGVGNANLLLEAIKQKPEAEREKLRFILMLDNDSASFSKEDKNRKKQDRGEEASKTLAEGLDALGVYYYKSHTLQDLGAKDPNEAYQNKKEDFTRAIIELGENFKTIKEAEEQTQHEEEKLAYINSTSAYSFLERFKSDIKESEKLKPTQTGFNSLDLVFSGGLPKGLLTIGALTSLGKTTLAMQLADQIAETHNNDILFFSLEMSRSELISKSISRLTFLNAYYKTKDIEKARKLAKTNNGILQGTRYKDYTEEEKEIIEKSIADYATFANHIFIKDSVASEPLGVKEIETAIKEHIKATGKKPIIFIDYLQIMKSPDPRLSDKQALDYNISTLKRISAQNALLIIAISSLNRASYSEKVDLASFKESGAVEYTNDILIGLNLSKIYEVDHADYETLEKLQLLTKDKKSVNELKLKAFISKEKQKDPREITLEVLKNRNGKTGGRVSFVYFPAYNIYIERTNPFNANEKNLVAPEDLETQLKLLDNSRYESLLGDTTF